MVKTKILIIEDELIVAMNTHKGLTFLGVVYLFAALLFFLMTQKNYKKVVTLENA